jgi:hypothetical protein
MQTHIKQTRLLGHTSLTILLYTFLSGVSFLFLGSCTDCETTNTYSYYEPVYTSLETLRSSVDLVEPQPVTAVGKIYFKDGFLFVNEPGEGIHIIDNRNPAAPIRKSFIKIPGNYDLAIKGNTLYADSYIDLVALDISDLTNVHEVNRIENMFMSYNSYGFYVDPSLGLVTSWEVKEEVVVRESCDTPVMGWGGFYYMEGIALSSDVSASSAPGNGSTPGVGGSMARFTISRDYLYALDASNLQPVDITNEQNPVAKDKVMIAADIETIFPHDNNLFVGASSGMHIMDISAPATPVRVSTYQHVRSCDPVVVDGDYAYVTLRSGTQCQGFSNQLEVIDIRNLSSPQLVKTYPMYNPHGLGKEENTLFVCDGEAGLKIFNAEDVEQIDQKLLAHYNTIHAYDVIPLNNVLMMIGEDGIYQYDYSNTSDIKLLSVINISHEE